MNKKDSFGKVIYHRNLDEYFWDFESNKLNDAKSIISEVQRDELLIIKRYISDKLLDAIHENSFKFVVDMLIIGVLFLFIQYVLIESEEVIIWWVIGFLIFLCMFILKLVRIYKKHNSWIKLIRKELNRREP